MSGTFKTPGGLCITVACNWHDQAPSKEEGNKGKRERETEVDAVDDCISGEEEGGNSKKK